MKRINLLIVDDEEDIIPMFKFNFRKEVKNQNLTLSFFGSAQKCLDFLEKHKEEDDYYVLTDINMPEIDGVELLESIKHNFPYVDVFMISAYATKSYMEITQKKGAKKFFAKPIDFKYLKNTISEL